MKDSLLEQPMNDGMDYCEMFNFTLSSLRLNRELKEQKENWDGDVDTSTSAYCIT